MKNIKIVMSVIFTSGVLFFLFQNCSPYELSKINTEGEIGTVLPSGGKFSGNGNESSGTSNDNPDTNNDDGTSNDNPDVNNDDGTSNDNPDGNVEPTIETVNGNYAFKRTPYTSVDGFYFQLLKDNQIVSVAYIDWYVNGVKEEHGGSITFTGEDLLALKSCSFRLKAIHMSKGGDFIGSAETTMYVPNCAYDANQIPRSCNGNLSGGTSWSSLYGSSFFKVNYTDKLFSANRTIPVQFNARFNGYDGISFTPNVRGNINGTYTNAARDWEVEISECPSDPDPAGGNCYLQFATGETARRLLMVRDDLKAQYPERCALQEGKSYYINIRSIGVLRTGPNGEQASCLIHENYKCSMNPGAAGEHAPLTRY